MNVPNTSFAIYKPNRVPAPILANVGIKQSFRRLFGQGGKEMFRIYDERLAFGTWTKIYNSEKLL